MGINKLCQSADINYTFTYIYLKYCGTWKVTFKTNV